MSTGATLVLVALGAGIRPQLVAAVSGVLAAFGLIEPGAGVAGVLAGLAIESGAAYARGRTLRRREPARRLIGAGVLARTPRAWAAMVRRAPVRTALGSRFRPGEQATAFTAAGFSGALTTSFLIAAAASWSLWTLVYMGTSMLAAAFIAAPAARLLGPVGLIAGVLLAIWLPRPVALALTRAGRQRLRTAFNRATRREYWPAWVQYASLTPVFVRQGLKHGGAAFTCCNPGIAGGGGMVGESKTAILGALNGSAAVLPAALIPAGGDPASRARAATAALSHRPELGGFPAILKPDHGERGFAVRLARSAADVDAYFRQMHSAALVQRYHPGPHECGVLWVRWAGSPGGRWGRIFSITRKEFPVIAGDGRRTLEALIHDHPRFHCQAAVFLERFAEQRDRVLADGETLRLAHAGNHCQGTLFRDGADLITPDLEAAIDAIARSFAGGLDMGRFDLRYESDELLRRGLGFGVVELNGTAGESTNIYDPDRSIVWAYSVLAEQWRLMYELGAARQREGATPLPLLRLWREARRHFRERSGSAVSD